jgi:hypothetical protein
MICSCTHSIKTVKAHAVNSRNPAVFLILLKLYSLSTRQWPPGMVKGMPGAFYLRRRDIMKLSYFGILAIMIVVIGVAVAGCASNSPSAPATGTPASVSPPGPAGSSAPTAAATAGSSSGGGISGASLFGGLSYNWVEYKTSAQGTTIYIKFDKTAGTCTMRFEGANVPQGMPTTMDCSSSGKSQNNPNQITSDAQVTCSPISEQVTVPAGSFSATKCTVVSQGTTSTTWVVPGKYMVKSESNTAQGPVDLELNAYG